MLLAICSVGVSFGQTLTGKVSDSKGEPLVGAVVSVKGTATGAPTDLDGVYTLKMPVGTSTVVFSMVGTQTVEQNVTLTAGQTQTLDITLSEDAAVMNEVVVIGYGVQRKTDLTGSVASLSSDKFQKGNVVAPEQLILGKIAGVQVIAASGAPGAGANIRIRGQASISASSYPLIVIDGVPIEGNVGGIANPLAMINPNDIENFTVLKDASATAIYGSRGSNGVILITTKKGASGKMKIGFSSNLSIAQNTKLVDVLNGDEFRTLVNAKGNSAQIALLGKDNTNWQEQIYRTAISSDNNLNFSGAYKKLPYRVSLGYTDQNGVLLGSNMQRTSAALNLTPSLLDKHLTFDIGYKLARTRSLFANEGAIGSAVVFDPTKPIKSGKSEYLGYYEWLDPSSDLPNTLAPRNPVSLLNSREDIGYANRHLINGTANYKFHFLPDLKATLTLGLDKQNSEGTVVVDSAAASVFTTKGIKTEYTGGNTNKLLDFYLTYAKEIKNHRFDAMAGYGYQDNISSGFGVTRNFAGDTIGSKTNLSGKQQYTLVSFYSRANYSYKNKYYLTATVRTDGSSKLSREKRWATFPSGAISWRLSEEKFLKDANLFSNLKLRLGYGETGQQNIGGNYLHLTRFMPSDNTAQYQFGNQYYQTLRPEGFNGLLGWERTRTTNLALDFLWRNDRIGGTIEVYDRQTLDLLLYAPVPAGANLTNGIIQNVGSMENKGVELTLNVTPIKKKDMNLDLSFNIARNQNKVLSLTRIKDTTSIGLRTGGIAGAVGNNIQINTEGYPINSFYVQKQVFENGVPVSGKYEDLNGDGVADTKDFYRFKSPNPDYFFGLSANFTYKDFMAGFSMRSNIGNYMYNNRRSANSAFLQSSLPFLINTVRDENAAAFNNNEYFSDYYMENASFLRMDNITVGYNLSKVVKNKVNLQLTAVVQNAFVITKYSGLDPEIDGGIDNTIYPRPRTISIGINVTY